MSQYQVEVSEIIDGPAGLVYEILADYHEGHPAVLPARYFTDITVVQGGRGAGTVIDVAMSVFGAKQLYRMTVSEPEPGRVLVEEDPEAGVVTTFTVDPIAEGKRSRVTINTVAQTSPGLRGLFEKLMTPMIARRIYRQELRQLNEYVRAQASPSAQ